MGLHDQELNSQEMEQHIQEREIENEFVVVDKSMRGINNSSSKKILTTEAKKGKSLAQIRSHESEMRNSVDQVKAIRKSYLVRQIGEGVLGVKQEDYDENGQLDLAQLN